MMKLFTCLTSQCNSLHKALLDKEFVISCYLKCQNMALYNDRRKNSGKVTSLSILKTAQKRGWTPVAHLQHPLVTGMVITFHPD